ncbi:Apolipoprotein L domain-containing protein 1 Vascular early response gene protein [Channa argus]|uniref:Apolipoprotein L domain-containing protein 1 Vascular early response gene protein n=1 Tax=Channa argus TaxID=215402 RepID=A0A6G1Q7Q8_CHAAH|nr:Apolipoprotein L domain-containing protein 1 Vascular early response gene protein [Channa argus]
MSLQDNGGFFSGIFKKSSKPDDDAPEQEIGRARGELSTSSDSLPENNKDPSCPNGDQSVTGSKDNLSENSKEKGGFFSGFLRKANKIPVAETSGQKQSHDDFSTSKEVLSENTSKVKGGIFTGILKKCPKPSEDADPEEDRDTEEELSASNSDLSESNTTKESPTGEEKKLSASLENLLEGMISKDPLSSSKELSASWDSLADTSEENLSAYGEFLPSSSDLSDAKTTTKESEDKEDLDGDKLRRRRTIKKKRHYFQEDTVEVQPVEMAPYPTEDNPLESEQESELMEWWNTVKGWTEWNETSNSQDEEIIMEQAADRVYLAARLFVQLFNQRGASLQHRILELLALADAADQFHKKTVRAAVGGGVASVAGSVATITGLILAPFTFGASVIVTAVGISVATAGSITSATANITDTVHSSMDRKKVEKMIQGYQEEIKDIRECLEFVQEGMDTLQEWDFEQYSQSAAKKALNHSVKHVVREGGRAGKELVINTDKLISTVHVLGAAGGAAKAAQVISLTTGIMSALFLALDVFFLAKDSHELRKGAKTKFAAKIREVCKDLQDGVLELNKVKTQLQKTMDGIEVEEYEEIEEVEVEVEYDLEWDLKKLAKLEEELDLMEEKLDKKVAEEQKKSEEMGKDNVKFKGKKEKKTKEHGDGEKKDRKDESSAKKEGKKEQGEVKNKIESTLEKVPDETEKSVKAATGVVEEQPQKENQKDKESEDSGTNTKTVEKDKKVEDKNKSGNSEREDRGGQVKTQRDSQGGMRSREDLRRIKPEWRSVNIDKGVESHGTRRHNSTSNREDGEGGSKPEMTETDEQKGSSSRDVGRDSWTGTEEDRAVNEWRAENANRTEEKREITEATKSKSESERAMKRDKHRKSDGGNESHRSEEAASRKREWRSSTEESNSKTSHRGGATARCEDWRERGDEKRGSRLSVGRQAERAGGDGEEEEETKRGKRREDGDRWRRDRQHEHSRRGNRPRANALLGDGLYI